MYPEQITNLNDRPVGKGAFILYWMQRSQRAESNLALEYAIELANERDLPVLTAFVVMERYPDANERHFAFMLQGLEDVAAKLAERGIGFTFLRGTPPDPIVELALHAAAVVCDRGYLKHLKLWRHKLARKTSVRVCQVEDNAVVPVELVSGKREYAARTIRPKIHKHLDAFLPPIESGSVVNGWKPVEPVRSIARFDAESTLSDLSLSTEVAPVDSFVGGREEGLRRLDRFVSERLRGYADRRSDPSLAATSTLSPFLHFGNLSPVEIVRAVLDSDRGSKEDNDTLIEELVVRRELAINYTENEPEYDRYDALPSWARDTLREHAADDRPYEYSVEELEAAETHDPYWNASMMEMRKTGFMQNYMRMYWGKKILEWTAAPEDAFYTTLYLNNKYFLDGRDPNSYAGAGWIFGLHDRPWKRRPIFGTVRYMNANGLKRKFDIERYVAHVEAL